MLKKSTTTREIDHSQARLPSLLRWTLKNTLYAHFCAGENRNEIGETLKQLKVLRYDGVILEYALETGDSSGKGGRSDSMEAGVEVQNNQEAIETWKRGMVETLNMVEPGDFVGVKSVLPLN